MFAILGRPSGGSYLLDWSPTCPAAPWTAPVASSGGGSYDLQWSSTLWAHALAYMEALKLVPAAGMLARIYLSLRGSGWGPPVSADPEST